MASDPTAGGAPAEMPVDSSDPNLDIPPKPEGVVAEVEQLQAEKADLQDKLAPDADGNDVVWKFDAVKKRDYDFTKNVRYE